MEAMQDKRIREKINRLDTLPDGYAPSLDRKWELLQAGKPHKQEKPLYFWYAAAASFLLLLGFGFMLWQPEKQLPEIAAANPKPVLPNQSALQPSSEITKFSLQSESTGTQISQSKEKQKNAILKPVKALTQLVKTHVKAQERTNPEIQAAVTSPKSFPAISSSEKKINEAPATLAASENTNTPKKRNRYIEVDFDAPVTPAPAPPTEQTAQVQFKLKVLPQGRETNLPASQTNNPIKLQHTF